MVRPYETIVVFDGTLGDEALQKEQKKVEDILQKGAELERTDVWGKRELAYQIKKKRLGYYCLFLYKGEADVIEKMQSDFRLNASVLRHLSVVREEVEPVEAKEPEKSDTEPAEAAKEPEKSDTEPAEAAKEPEKADAEPVEAAKEPDKTAEESASQGEESDV